jgi:hypothetical protein
MSWKACLCALAAVAAWSVYPALADDQCPPLKVMASFNLTFTKNGTPLVPVTVNGHQVNFVLGTNIAVTSISFRFAQELDLHREYMTHTRFVTSGGQLMPELATMNDFELGPLKAENVRVLLEPAQPTTAQLPPGAPVGTLGADFLRPYDVDIDFAAGKMNLISRDHCVDRFLYWKATTVAKLPMTVGDDNRIYFPMTLDGHEFEARLNTSSPMSTIKDTTAKQVFNVDGDSSDNTQLGTFPDGSKIYAHQFKSLTAEGLVIANPKLVLMQSKADQYIEGKRDLWRPRMLNPDMQPDLTLGMSELKHLHIYIDYHHQTIYLTPSENNSAPS